MSDLKEDKEDSKKKSDNEGKTKNTNNDDQFDYFEEVSEGGTEEVDEKEKEKKENIELSEEKAEKIKKEETVFKEDDRVEVNFMERGKWYPGRIKGVNGNGTYDVIEDDGFKQDSVKKDMIRLKKSDDKEKEESKEMFKDEILECGWRVDVNKGGYGKWYPGRISDVNEDGTYNILYDEGDVQLVVERSFIRLIEKVEKPIEKPIEPSRRREYKYDDDISIGTRVEVNLDGRGVWYPGRVSFINSARGNLRSGSSLLYEIRCDNGEIGYVRREYIRRIDVEERANRIRMDKEKTEMTKEKKEMEKYVLEFNNNIDNREERTIKKETLIKIIRNYDYNVEVALLKGERQIVEKTLQNAYFYDYINYLGDRITTIEYLNIIKHLERNFRVHSKKLLEQAEKEVENKIREKDAENDLLKMRLDLKQREESLIKKREDMDMKRQEINLESEVGLNEYYIERHIEIKKKEQELKNAENNLEIEKRLLSLKEEKKNIHNQVKMLNYGEEMELYELNELTKYSKFGLDICCKQDVIEDFDKIYELIVNLPSLSVYEKNLILIRFKAILTYCALNYLAITKLYNITRMIIITCSIVNPALLSINSDVTNPNYMTFYWTVWCSQILVSLITGYVGLFKWDRKHLIFNAYKTKINQEIWLYLELAGKHYTKAGEDEEEGEVSHSYYLNKFLSRLEFFYTQLKTSELEIESTKDDNKGNEKNVGSTTGGKKSQATTSPEAVLQSNYHMVKR